MRIFRTCAQCGATLDPQEGCDCRTRPEVDKAYRNTNGHGNPALRLAEAGTDEIIRHIAESNHRKERGAW